MFSNFCANCFPKGTPSSTGMELALCTRCAKVVLAWSLQYAKDVPKKGTPFDPRGDPPKVAQSLNQAQKVRTIGIPVDDNGYHLDTTTYPHRVPLVAQVGAALG